MVPCSDSVDCDYLNLFRHDEYVPLICCQCRREFSKFKPKIVRAIKYGSSIVCSVQCYGNLVRNKRINAKCQWCQADITITQSDFNKSKSKRFFCNHSCAAQFSNRTRNITGRDRRRKYVECEWCHKQTSGSAHCSSACGQKHYQANQWEKRRKRIEDSGGFESENRHLARKYLIEKHGHICVLCQTSTWSGQPVPLVCDHIDGDSDNNRLDNLRMICQNCNALLPTFGSRNRGRGRKSKRDAYHRNKLISTR